MRLAADAEHGRSVNGGAMAARDRVSSACSGIGAAVANKCVSVGGHGGVQEMVRLEGGGYLHEIKRVVGMPWERLALQVSQPVVAENAATASEVSYLDRYQDPWMPMKSIIHCIAHCFRLTICGIVISRFLTR